MKRKKFSLRFCALICSVSIIFLSISSYAAANSKMSQGGTENIRAVTYMGREWVMNFWSTETDYADEDFDQIVSDGFNTIILCVPWREFQPNLTTYLIGVGAGTLSDAGFNEDALQKLTNLIEKAADHDLSVMLRLGYTWDYYHNSSVLSRYESLIYDESYQDAWISYAHKIYETVSPYENFAGAFLTWEDFWNFVATEAKLAGSSSGTTMARQMGYTDYVLSRYSYDERLSLYGSSSEANNPGFPSTSSPAYKLFLEWYDFWLISLLTRTQEVFPNLSMECRLDVDPYRMEDGRLAGYRHIATFNCGSASYSSFMLSSAMGFAEGTGLDATLAHTMSRQILEEAAPYAEKPMFVDQFLYMETTPGYENIAHISEGEINTYLQAMGTTFRELTIGYGIWSYRDYADNLIYNPEFGLDLDGWSLMGRITIEKYDGSKMAHLPANSILSQQLTGRGYLSSNATKVSLRVVTDEPVQIHISLGRESVVIPADKDGTYTTEFSKQVNGTLNIFANNDVLIDNIKVYSHLTRGDIYQIDGSPGSHLEGIRALNQSMQ